MARCGSRFWTLTLLLSLLAGAMVWAQQVADPGQPPPPPDPSAAPPQGVEIQARGPVHEAFAAPAAQPEPTLLVPKKPPDPINEMPPDTKPDGSVIWVGGYWAWDDDRKDYLWVSGIWRTVPPGKEWVPGYWRQETNQYQWVPGFWNTAAAAPQAAAAAPQQQVTYLPAPPAPPQVAPPGEAPNAGSFYVPGSWYWDGYRYAWRAGYWAQVQPGYVWVAAHYRWTPSGYIFIPGYWDYSLETRGVMFAPVVVDPLLVGPGFVYRPVYVVPAAVVVDAFFIRPAYCHYYFGDYYGPAYHTWGFEATIVYGRRSYDPVFTYVAWEHRGDPGWRQAQFTLTINRERGFAPRPMRVVDVRGGRGGIVTFHSYAAARRMNTVRLSPAEVAHARTQAVAMQRSAAFRGASEARMPRGSTLTRPSTAALARPSIRPVGPASTARGPAVPGRGVTPGARGTVPARGPLNTRSGPLNQQRSKNEKGKSEHDR